MVSESLYKKIVAECKFALKRKNSDIIYDIAHDLIISDTKDSINETNYRSKIKYAIAKALSRVNHIEIDKVGWRDKSNKIFDNRCIKCNQILPASGFKDYINPKGFRVKTNICYGCTKERRLAYYYNVYKYVKDYAKESQRKKAKYWGDKFYRQLYIWKQQQRRKNKEYRAKENKAAMLRYQERYKTDAEYREGRLRAIKKYKQLNREKINEQVRKRYHKNIELGRSRNKEYRKRGNDKTAKERMKRFVKKQKEILGDWYIKRLLNRHNTLKIPITSEMIEEKRKQVLKMRNDGNWRTIKKGR